MIGHWSHLREQINRTFQFRNCNGKFFCSSWYIHGNNPRAVSVWEKRLHTKTSLPVGKRYLPMGKKASVTTTIMYIRTLIQAIKQIPLIVQQSSVLLSVCELAINPAFAQASKQFDANRPSTVILLHLLASAVYWNTRTQSKSTITTSICVRQSFPIEQYLLLIPRKYKWIVGYSILV